MLFVPLRKKIGSTLITYLLISSLFTVALLTIFSIITSSIIIDEGIKNIESTLISRGEILIQNNSIALQRMAEENAFYDIRQMVVKTVQSDRDITFGLYDDIEHRTWVMETTDSTIPPQVNIRSWVDNLTEPSYIHLNDQSLIVFAAPIFSQDRRLGTIRYGFSTTHMNTELKAFQTRMKVVTIRFMSTFLLVILIFVFICLHSATKQAVTITKPIAGLTEAAKKIRDGAIYDPISIHANDEIGILAETLEEMRKQLENHTIFLEKMVIEKSAELNTSINERLLQANKLVTLGTLVTGVAHEINNPNNSILLTSQNFAEMCHYMIPILDQYVDLCGDFKVGRSTYLNCKSDIIVGAQRISENSLRIKLIVESLKNFGRNETLDGKAKVNVNKAIHKAVDMLQSGTKKSLYNLKINIQDDLPTIVGFNHQIEQIITNLVQNGIQAHPKPGGLVAISTKYNENSDSITITVADNGIGMDKETQEQMFDSFFTRKSTTGGTGLGLYVCSQIIKDHDGTIAIDSALEKGTTVSVTFPILLNEEVFNV